MALLIDGPPSCIDDLTAHDSQLLDVASAEGIDVTKKLALAHEHVGIEVDSMLRRYLTAPRMEQVVVTPLLQLWHAYRTLNLVYVDAYHNQLNDRYAAKRDQFEQRAKWACEKLMEIGIGMTSDPVPRPERPEVLAAPGFLTDGFYYVTTTWVNATGEEGAPAAAGSVMTSGSTFRVLAGSAPAIARGWNVYAGADPAELVRQNGDLIPPDEGWLQPGALMVTGPKPGTGQSATYLYAIQRLLQRG